MKTLAVSGKTFFIDDEDLLTINKFKWHASKGSRGNVYLRSQYYVSGKRITVYFHRLIMNADTRVQVDHINGDTSDNRKINLRICTQQQNLVNNRQRIGISGFRGVWPSNGGDAWVAIIKNKGRRVHLGTFSTPEEAHAAWVEESIRLRGEFVCLDTIKVPIVDGKAVITVSGTRKRFCIKCGHEIFRRNGGRPICSGCAKR